MNAGNGTRRVRVTTDLTGLVAGTVYYWRLVARNAAGLTVGTTKSFKTIS